MRLYFIRHGESQANVLQVISNRGLKYGLTNKGRAQAAALAQKLAPVPFVRLYSSPLLRALQTAEILSHDLGMAYEISDALREYDCGDIEDKSDPASWQTHYQLRAAWFVNKEWEKRIEGGESFLDIQQRFLPFFKRLIKEFGATQDNVLLIGHGGLFQCMLPLVFTNIAFEHVLELPGRNTGIILAELSPSGMRCLEWDGQVMS